MEHRKYGYARVSSKDQNLDRQLESLKMYVDERDIITDKASGKDNNRAGLRSLIDLILHEGDALYIHSLDRLGRNKEGIKNILAELRAKKVSVHILDLPTTMTIPQDEIASATMDMINNLLIEVLGYMAELERKNIRKRQNEGIAVARSKGVRFGRKELPMPDSWEDDYRLWKNKKCTAMSLIKKYGWAPPTFYRKVKTYEAKSNFKFYQR